MKKIQAVIDRWEGDYAILKFFDGQELKIKKDLLGQDLKEGDVLDFTWQANKKVRLAREKKVKNLLKEII